MGTDSLSYDTSVQWVPTQPLKIQRKNCEDTVLGEEKQGTEWCVQEGTGCHRSWGTVGRGYRVTRARIWADYTCKETREACDSVTSQRGMREPRVGSAERQTYPACISSAFQLFLPHAYISFSKEKEQEGAKKRKTRKRNIDRKKENALHSNPTTQKWARIWSWLVSFPHFRINFKLKSCKNSTKNSHIAFTQMCILSRLLCLSLIFPLSIYIFI